MTVSISMRTSSLLDIIIPLAVIINFSHYSLNRCLATDTRLKFNCSGSSYEPNSSFEKNLQTLFSLLAENATMNTYRFYNTSVGGDDDGSGKVYGLYLCRGDDSRRDCRECVANATWMITQDCPNRPIEATIWYVDCMVRYWNKSMFQVVETSPAPYIIKHENMTADLAPSFTTLVGDTLRQLVKKAVNSSDRYATMEVGFGSYDTVYTMAQCTPDLSTVQCLRCLGSATSDLPICCTNSKGAWVMTPSCFIRYDLTPFYKPTPGSQSLQPPFSGKRTSKRMSTPVSIALAVLVALLVILAALFVYVTWRKRSSRYHNNAEADGNHGRILIDTPQFDYDDGNVAVADDLSNAESIRYDCTLLRNATNGFSEDNKLGQGGFGIVYKGILADGQQIAVKRLSEGSNQGAEQFTNEVLFVAKLQHRNLVRLLGFSLARYEKLLVYEFIPNRSLDLFLFDPLKRSQLDWPTRYNIIKGIARGMLYLHEDSRLKIIHRDLKASNILLDADMNPKISDFGTARNFGVDESPANTNRIAGTFGYMAPEYVLHGEFSVKSDVYSFGVLVLEIICGKTSTSFRHSNVAKHISTFVWNKWNEGNLLEVIDPCLMDSYSDEVKRCIQIGLLCVQDDKEKRPTMASVVFNINSNSELPVPQKSAFYSVANFSSSATNVPGFSKSSSNSIQLSFGSEEPVSKSGGSTSVSVG